MPVTPQEFFERIEKLSPSFARVVDDHRKDFPEFLAHILMADLLRFIGSGLAGPESLGVSPPTIDELKKILAILDEEFSTENPDAESPLGNAIAVSFIEYIDTEPFFERLEPLLGPALRAGLKRQKDWWAARSQGRN